MSKKKNLGSKILLVEDEEGLALGLQYNLTEEGYKVTLAKDGEKALEFFDKNDYDLVILDIMLPHFSGYEITEYIRSKQPKLPILLLTAMTAANDRVRGLKLGADDYVTKPFHLEELLLRVKGMLKRKSWYESSTELEPVYRFGNNEINFDSLHCTRKKRKYRLTPHEAMALKYLIENKGKVVSRKELLEKVWNISSDVETRTVDNFIARLRKYIEEDHSNPVHIKSIRGAGYMFFE